MANIQINEIIKNTELAIDNIAKAERPNLFYPEMIDLIGTLKLYGYEVNIVSASNVWSVRWLVINYLNPLLQDEYGDNIVISPQDVYGMNTLINDNTTQRLYKDEQLLHSQNYRNLNSFEIEKYTLTSLINYPATSYYGKAATILKNISLDKIFLVAGDSPNDFAMQRLAENVLWIARLNKPEYQRLAEKKLSQE
jgi:phosphoserine phosphatase